MKKLFKTISEHRGHSVTCKKNVDNSDIAEIWCDKCSVIIFSVNKENDAFRYERVLSHQNNENAETKVRQTLKYLKGGRFV